MKATVEEFCLCTAPWLPCSTLDGHSVQLGLVAALVRAHELRGLADPSPLVAAALTRMLLAIVHRSIDGPKSIAEWLELVRQGRLPAAKVTAYLERVRSRLNLFDPQRPFAQVRGLDVEPADATTLIMPSSDWGGGTGLFAHRHGGQPTPVSPAVAARWLVARQAFYVGGTISGRPKYSSAAPLTAAAVVLVRGSSLFETLVSNLLVYAPERSAPIPGTSSDCPHWEQEPQAVHLESDSEPKRVPRGWLDSLTWLSRRIELVVEAGRVVGWKRAAWQGVASEAAPDPMVAWVSNEKTGRRAVRIDSSRSFWRNSHALFEGLEVAGESRQRPAALAQIARREARAVFPAERRFTLDVLGIATDQAVIEMERWDRLEASAALLADPDGADAVRGGIDVAESVYGALRKGLWVFARHAVAPSGRAPDAKDLRRFVEGLAIAPEYWNACESAFSHFLALLSSGGRDAALADLRGRVRGIAEAAFERGVRALGENARSIRAIALASSWFRASLAALQPTQEGAAS
jgi:CRISPR system Cascade subunit CasA